VSTRASELDLRDGRNAALGVGAGGLLALVLGWILHSTPLRLVGLVAAVAGGGLYARGKAAERSEKIEQAQAKIRSELDELDPVARAQVLEGLVRPES
jgi:hypothetical protein